ncbi:MAG: DedA family protein [Mediterranea sp.]|jgi:membrane-associated protein|nr:DedA family protein [Mediterranea sp.]
MDFIIDFILHIDEHLEYIVNTYHLWTYAILFLIIFCETGLVVTPFLPGDSLIFAAGAIVAREGVAIDVHLLALVLFTAAVLGDTCNYEIGRFFGKKLFGNPNSKIFKQSYLDKTHEFYKKYGGKTIILARFVPIVRTFAPFVAGMGRMHYFYFLSYNLIGGAMWVAIFCYVGYFFGNVPFVQENFGLIAIAIIVISVMPAIVEVIRERRKAKKAKQTAKAEQ